MPRVQENAPGILPSRSLSRGSRISTMTTSSLCAALIASTALTVSISALASSTRDLIPRWMVWGMDSLCLLISFAHDLIGKPVPTFPDHALSHQFLHRIFESLDRDRVHAIGENAFDDGGRFRIVPMLLRDRIEPHRMRIGARDALKPDGARFFVDVLHRAARHHDLVGR